MRKIRSTFSTREPAEGQEPERERAGHRHTGHRVGEQIRPLEGCFVRIVWDYRTSPPSCSSALLDVDLDAACLADQIMHDRAVQRPNRRDRSDLPVTICVTLCHGRNEGFPLRCPLPDRHGLAAEPLGKTLAIGDAITLCIAQSLRSDELDVERRPWSVPPVGHPPRLTDRARPLVSLMAPARSPPPRPRMACGCACATAAAHRPAVQMRRNASSRSTVRPPPEVIFKGSLYRLRNVDLALPAGADQVVRRKSRSPRCRRRHRECCRGRFRARECG